MQTPEEFYKSFHHIVYGDMVPVQVRETEVKQAFLCGILAAFSYMKSIGKEDTEILIQALQIFEHNTNIELKKNAEARSKAIADIRKLAGTFETETQK